MTWTVMHWNIGMAQAHRIEELNAARLLFDHSPHVLHCGNYGVSTWPCPTASAVLDKLLGVVRESENQEKTPAETGVSAGLADSQVPSQSAETTIPEACACDWCSIAFTEAASDDCVNPEHRATDVTLGLRDAGCGCCVIVDATALNLLRGVR